jgi:hypothetical protein
MIRSQQFVHCLEIAALGQEQGNADRFVELFKSQGDYQALRRHGFDDAALGIDRFESDVVAALGTGEVPFWFTYRARIGVRGSDVSPAGRQLRIVRLVIARCSVDYAGRSPPTFPRRSG